MRVCLLGNNKSVHIQKWVEALSKSKEIDLHVVTFDEGLKFKNVTYHLLINYAGNKLDYLFNIPKLRKIIKEINPDIVHSHYATSYGFMGAMLNFKAYIITGWGADIFDSPKNPIMKIILKYSLRKARIITVLSEMTLKEISKLTDKDIKLIPFGVDVIKFNKTLAEKKDTITIGTIRTLSEKYGVEYLIRAFAIVCSKHENVRLEIIGNGELMNYLTELTRKLNISEKVKFYGFINQISDFVQYLNILKSFDIFVIPSVMESETFGVAAVEASACSIPVIATNIGGLKEVIVNNKTGILVPPRDTDRLAEALEKLILDNDLRITLGNTGRKRVEEFYNWETNVNGMINIYKNCLTS